jgi:hypothetical protein
VTGGQATSIPLDKSKYGTDWMNGTQYDPHHLFRFFEDCHIIMTIMIIPLKAFASSKETP